VGPLRLWPVSHLHHVAVPAPHEVLGAVGDLNGLLGLHAHPAARQGPALSDSSHVCFLPTSAQATLVSGRAKRQARSLQEDSHRSPIGSESAAQQSGGKSQAHVTGLAGRVYLKACEGTVAS
jgi:hypothetical protein